MTARVDAEALQVRLGGRLILDGVGLTVGAGEVVGVVGANGAGKTTLLRAVLGLTPLLSGAVRLGGREVGRLRASERAALAAYLPQGREAGWNLPAWRIASLGAFDRPPAEARARALAALERVGLADLADRGVLDMSGGERARVLFARLLASGAPTLVADEPAAGLDPDAQLLVMERLREEADRGAAVLLTLHDLTLAARGCDRLLVLGDGRVIRDAPPAEALAPAVLAAAFGLEGRLAATEAGPVLAARRRT